MQTTHIHDYARQLLEAHGARAPAEAARRAVTFEQQGDSEQAQIWRRIEQAVLLLRGARQS